MSQFGNKTLTLFYMHAQLNIVGGHARYGHVATGVWSGACLTACARIIPVCLWGSVCVTACLPACVCVGVWVCEWAACLESAVRMHSGDQRRPRECVWNPEGLVVEDCALFSPYISSLVRRRAFQDTCSASLPLLSAVCDCVGLGVFGGIQRWRSKCEFWIWIEGRCRLLKHESESDVVFPLCFLWNLSCRPESPLKLQWVSLTVMVCLWNGMAD